MGEVIDFGGPTTLDIPPEKVLAGAADAKLSMVIVIGEDAEGMLYHACSTADIAEMLLALEMFKHEIMKQAMG